jgi:transposase
VAALALVQFPDGWAQRSYDRLLTMYRLVTEQLVEQTRLLRELAATERYREPLRLLQTVPGIGVITGMALLLELGEISRFTRADALAAYAGLTPSQYSSGDRIRMGRITGMGNRYLRSLLIEAAWVAVRRDSHLRAVYDRLKQRAGGKRAIVAVARRLLLAARRVLLDQTEYRCRAAA